MNLRNDVLSFDLTSADTITDVGLTEVGVLVIPPTHRFLSFEAANNDVTAGYILQNFSLQGKAHPDAQWETLISGATWASVAGMVFHAAALASLAESAKDTVVVQLPGPFSTLRFLAHAAVGKVITSVSVRGTLVS